MADDRGNSGNDRRNGNDRENVVDALQRTEALI